MTRFLKAAPLMLGAGLSLALTMPVHAQDTAAPDAAETAPAVEVDANTVLAVVDGTEITMGHLIAALLTLPSQYQQLPDDVLLPGLVEQLIQQTVLSNAMTELTPRAEIRLENERRSLIAAEVLDGILVDAVTDEGLQALYDETYADAEPTPQWHAAHILVETEDEAKALIDELNGGADFAELAKEKSTGPSGPNGGDLGWFGPGMMVAPFEEAVAGLEVGAISAPVQTQFGWHVIKLSDKEMQGPPALEEVRDELVTELENRAVDAAIEELTAGAEIERTDTTGMDASALRDLSLLD